MKEPTSESVAQRKSAFRQVQLGAYIARALLVEDRTAFERLRLEQSAEGAAAAELETQFLWGAFSELVERSPPLPAPASERVKLQLIRFLTQQRGFPAKQAIAMAQAVEVLRDVADPSFERAQASGREAIVSNSDFLGQFIG